MFFWGGAGDCSSSGFSLQILDLCLFRVMFSIRSTRGEKNHYLFQPSGANLKAQSRPNVQLAGGN